MDSDFSAFTRGFVTGFIFGEGLNMARSTAVRAGARQLNLPRGGNARTGAQQLADEFRDGSG